MVFNQLMFLNQNPIPEPVENPYLTFSSDSSFTLESSYGYKSWNGTMEYSTDEETWSTWLGEEITSGSIYETYKICLRGTGNSTVTYNYPFTITGSSVSCSGNIENILDYEEVELGNHPTMGDSCFRALFKDCTALTSAPNLPATTLTKLCYFEMFSGCTSLELAPEMSPTTLGIQSCDQMFYGCSSLTSAPELPATELTTRCYNRMFYGCSSLLSAPSLPALTTVSNCYSEMFFGCTSLITAPSLPATVLTTQCYYRMFYGCTSLRTGPSTIPATSISGSSSCSEMFSGCTSLTNTPELSATELNTYCYSQMFYNCTSLTKLPLLPATVMKTYCYFRMFDACSGIKVSATETGEYTHSYAIPPTLDGTTVKNCMNYMFRDTGGTFTGTPTINTTYYTDHEPV